MFLFTLSRVAVSAIVYNTSESSLFLLIFIIPPLFAFARIISNRRRLARPLRETYPPSYWHFPQPATDWLPLGSRPKRRIMINEHGSWPTNRHSLSAHGIRLPPSLLSRGIMARSACAALHTRNVPVVEYEAQYACLSRYNRMPSLKITVFTSFPATEFVFCH